MMASKQAPGVKSNSILECKRAPNHSKRLQLQMKLKLTIKLNRECHHHPHTRMLARRMARQRLGLGPALALAP
jgi:hypothetical protein